MPSSTSTSQFVDFETRMEMIDLLDDDETKGAFACTTREVKVARVVASTTVVDMDYSRVEVEIDGELYEFSGPDAQVLGAHVNTAGGGDMFVKGTHEDALGLIRRVVLGQAFDRGDESKLALINEIVGEALFGDFPGAIEKAKGLTRA